jgi:hypothetical protein
MVEPCTNILVNAKLKTGNKRGKKKTEVTGRSPLRRRWLALDCSAIEEEEVAVGFKTGILFSLKMVHLYRNMSVMRFQN